MSGGFSIRHYRADDATKVERLYAAVTDPYRPEDANQVLAMQQRALTAQAVRALVTIGPVLEREACPPSGNVMLERFVPHNAVLPHAAVLVTQCAFGGINKALAHGVPMLCLPLVADQPDNAARVVARGAGLRLGPRASAAKIRAALVRSLTDPRFSTAARCLGAALDADHTGEAAARELESLA